MFVSSITFYNYRNLTDQRVQLHNGPIYITGQNGNGKTNFVEGLYLLSGSRSFRTNTQSELVRWGGKDASVFGSVVADSGEVEVGISLQPGVRKAYRSGEALPSVSDLVGTCSIVAFSPSDLSLIKGPPSGRRKFLDRHMVDLAPSFLNVVMGYQRALASKNALLKAGTCDRNQIAPWNELLTEYGVKTVDNRVKFLDVLNKSAAKFHAEFAGGDGELGLSLESDFVRSGCVLSAAEIRVLLDKASARESALRSSVIGAHKDDVAINLSGVDTRAYASQGQTRSVVLALKLGVIEMLEEAVGEAPIVILDDVDSELDQARTERLYQALISKKRQIFITGTEKPSEKLLSLLNTEVQVLSVQSGDIKSI